VPSPGRPLSLTPPARLEDVELDALRTQGLDPATAFVSIVVPVRNNREGLREVVRCLANQTLQRDRFEIVIGDDGSAPGSLDGFETPDGWIRVVSGPPQTSYAARNRAAGATSATVLAFCDSDCLPEPNWLEEGLAALQDADVVAGEVLFVAPPEPTVWSLLTIDMFLDQERNVRLSQAVTANLLVRRELFDELGGFDPTLPSGGDYDFVGRAVEHGARLEYSPRAVICHPTINERKAFLRKIEETNRWSAVRLARAGERPDKVSTILGFIPVAGIAWARRKALRPALRLQRQRLEASGITTGRRDRTRALVALYSLVACAAMVGRVRGWREGWQLTRRAGPPRRDAP
jgi:GT2 family glycosyltransferase